MYADTLDKWYDSILDKGDLDRIEWHINRDATVRIKYIDQRQFLTEVLRRLTDAQEDRKALLVALKALRAGKEKGNA